MRNMWPCADGGEGGWKRTTATTPSIVTSDSGGDNDEYNNGDAGGDACGHDFVIVPSTAQSH